jgi:DNA polymerase III epsilon subunit-like protein
MVAISDPALWEDLFTRDVDEQPVEFVRPADTEGPSWAAYEGGRYLGTLTAEFDFDGPMWRVQSTHEVHQDVDDAVRALRRPASWPSEREQVSCWARRLLADDALTAVDVETTGLRQSWAVQIAAVARDGTVLFSEYVNPRAEIEPGAIAVHGITPDRVVSAATFGELLPALATVLQGRTLVSYKAEFDRGCVERELTRHYGSADDAGRWLARCRWEDAMVPYAVWRGLWSVKRGTYRNQRLGGPHDAVADCRMLLQKLEHMGSAPALSQFHRAHLPQRRDQ